jgi:DNA-binding NarL/FixJ family response regulator
MHPRNATLTLPTRAGSGAVRTVRRVSSREMEVIRLLADGHPNRVIADVLFISERTVGNHLTNIYAKLDLSSRTALVAWAIRNKLA